MSKREILLLGNPFLYNVSREASQGELAKIKEVAGDLQDTLLDFRAKYGFGRAIAAPQIGEFLRMIYMNLDGQSYCLINPKLEFGDQQFELWDDCMSFPGLEVKVNRFQKVTMIYKDLEWQDQCWEAENDLCELIQHEYDHLDGILAVQRAVDSRSFRINQKKTGCF